MSELILPWLRRTASQKIIVPSENELLRQTDRLARNLKVNTSVNIFSGHLINASQNFGGLIVAGVKVRPDHIIHAMGVWTANPFEMSKFVTDKSKYMTVYNDQTVRETQNLIQPIIENQNIVAEKWNSLKAFTQEHYQILSKITQGIVGNIVWTASYNEAISKGSTDKHAIDIADSNVRQTQDANSPEQVSAFGSGTQTASVFKMFTNYWNMLGNLIASEITKSKRNLGMNSSGYGRMFYVYLMGVAAPAYATKIIMNMLSGAGSDDKEDGSELLDQVKLFLSSTAEVTMAMIPAIGPIGNTVVNLFNDKPYDDRLSLSPAISSMEDALKGIPATSKLIKSIGMESEDLTTKEVVSILKLLGITTGLPFGTLAKPVTYYSKEKSGQIKEATGPIDYTRGLITGKGE